MSSTGIFIDPYTANVGIGTTITTARLMVAGDIIPSVCNVYNLGSANLRFKDIYLSGNTIDIGGTPISQNSSNGSITIGTATNRLVFSTDGKINGVNIPALNKRTHTSYASASRTVNTWVTRQSAADISWLSVCWAPELSLFCAVSTTGTGNRVMTSSDGVSWVTRSAVDQSNSCICWAPQLSLFCSVSQGGGVMTSSDGITWITRSTPAANNWRGVCWASELSLFCAVGVSGTGNRIMTSSNGITWTTRSNPVDNSWISVCWAPELSLFCAVSSSGSGNRVMTSSDGITWVTQNSAGDQGWVSVCWAPELSLFCAVCSYNYVMTSPNGINWVTRANAVSSAWSSVCWAPELSLFCAVSITGTGKRIMTSSDGITWATRASAADNSWYGVCWAPELSTFCAVSSDGVGSNVMTSSIGMPNSMNVLKALPSQITVNQVGKIGIGTTIPRHTFDLQGGNMCVSGNIGIGTTDTTSGRLVVAGDIVPTGCNIYNLGNSNLMFKNVNTTTINLDGLTLSKSSTGGFNVLTGSGTSALTSAKYYNLQGTCNQLFPNNANIYKPLIYRGYNVTSNNWYYIDYTIRCTYTSGANGNTNGYNLKIGNTLGMSAIDNLYMLITANRTAVSSGGAITPTYSGIVTTLPYTDTSGITWEGASYDINYKGSFRAQATGPLILLYAYSGGPVGVTLTCGAPGILAISESTQPFYGTSNTTDWTNYSGS